MQAPVRGASQPAGCLDTAPSRQDPPPLRGFPTGRPRGPPQLSARPSPATLSVPQRSRAALGLASGGGGETAGGTGARGAGQESLEP